MKKSTTWRNSAIALWHWRMEVVRDHSTTWFPWFLILIEDVSWGLHDDSVHGIVKSKEPSEGGGIQIEIAAGGSHG